MDYRKIVVPFLDVQEIRKQADAFRQKFWGTTSPVEIENIIELKPKLNIIPLKGLLKLCDTDALIKSN